MSEAILAIINNFRLHYNLISKRKERAKQFSWQKTARLTLDAYNTKSDYQSILLILGSN